MGVEVVVDAAGALDWAQLLAELAPATVVMVDGGLVMPGAKIAEGWRDVRVKTQAGTFAVKRVGGTKVAVVAFGNADEAAKAMQTKLAEAIARASVER